MKKLVLILGLAAGTMFSSCSLFVRTPVASGGGSVGSIQPVKSTPQKTNTENNSSITPATGLNNNYETCTK